MRMRGVSGVPILGECHARLHRDRFVILLVGFPMGESVFGNGAWLVYPGFEFVAFLAKRVTVAGGS